MLTSASTSELPSQPSWGPGNELARRLADAMISHDAKHPPPACVSCKLLYPISKRLDRSGLFFPCSKHFTCWYCAEFLLKEMEEKGIPDKKECFQCPGGSKCSETMTIAEAFERVRGSRCVDCSTICFPQGNERPYNALGCDCCFRCLHCSCKVAKSIAPEFSPACPSKGCGAMLDRRTVDILAQRLCAVCFEPAKTQVSACGSTEETHYICDICMNDYLNEEASKPFEEMGDVLECPCRQQPFGCILRRGLVHDRIGTKCRQCKTRSKEFEMSECRTVCDPCLRTWITTFTEDNSGLIREIPCPSHPKRSECRINQEWIERTAGKICLVCLERKPTDFQENVAPDSGVSTPCNDHFVCLECFRQYCKQQMRDRVNAFSFPCPASASCANRVYYAHIQAIVGKELFDRWQQAKMERGLELVCQSRKCQRRRPSQGSNKSRQDVEPGSSHRLTVVSSVEVMCERCKCHMCIVCRETIRGKKGNTQGNKGHRSQRSHRCRNQQDYELLEHVRDAKNEIRPCVQCFRFIHREEGCNHMTCYGALGCGAEFCWVCLKPMNTIHVRCPLLSFGGFTVGNCEPRADFSPHRRHLPSLPTLPHFPSKWPKKLSFRSLRRADCTTLVTVPTTLLSE